MLFDVDEYPEGVCADHHKCSGIAKIICAQRFNIFYRAHPFLFNGIPREVLPIAGDGDSDYDSDSDWSTDGHDQRRDQRLGAGERRPHGRG